MSAPRAVVRLLRPLCTSNSNASLIFTRRTMCVTKKAIPKPKEVRKELQSIVGATKISSDQQNLDILKLSSLLVNDQSELKTRCMKDSYRECIIPLSTDHKLRDRYMTVLKGVRFGRILEDLDTMAVWIGYSHNDNPEIYGQVSPLVIVTALVDRIDLKHEEFVADRDIKIAGHVTWVGKTSMEIEMGVMQELNGEWHELIKAHFLMVARDPLNKRAAIVNPLAPVNDEERALFQKGEVKRALRQQQKDQSLMKVPPNQEEGDIVHGLFLEIIDPEAGTFKRTKKPEGSMWMEEAILKNIHICQWENRNLYGKMFGGFLMRRAFELAWCNASVYSHTRPRVIAVDDIMFQAPVEVGSLLYLSSQVVYTDGPCIQMKVHAETVDPLKAEHKTTNVFHFTFKTDIPKVPRIMPKSYIEAMMYIDGRRHYLETMGQS
ncbi:acyl-coenzyme A thioesterase 9, mitochondrial isoform X2 [Lingula anatina]|uniref:Acyl-coenzyme A thioesterase 9, mitochondrial isoform X2 n=1 Tax=Lingula anatina TaxID=7574 RepID=A0A1S3H5E5_LINAN|nr:acyl-coenzyme A thioesterase 9, mitochondrial isoform X2 [Lingula anatina]|eukprot:XP_013381228.1 acyl-coenzyme A thioesterase 9, mitochondrial isoform X2 [Lingula anatina]